MKRFLILGLIFICFLTACPASKISDPITNENFKLNKLYQDISITFWEVTWDGEKYLAFEGANGRSGLCKK